MIPPLSRRTFIRITGLGVLGAIAAACSKKPKGPQTLDDVIAKRPQDLTVIPAQTEMLHGRPERVAFGMARPSDNALVPELSGRCWVAPSRTEAALGPFTFSYHGDGLGARGVYETEITFPADGSWLMFVEATGNGKTFTGTAGGFTVGKQTAMPQPGDAAIVVPTPTTADHHGVEPICTRKPACAMHAISLDDALKNGKPTVLIIATPAFCQSQLCGPEVDIVQDIASTFAAKANFIHVEVYRDAKPATIQQAITSPAATAWRLDQEPAIYYIAKDGVIAARSLGPVDRADVREQTTKLVSA